MRSTSIYFFSQNSIREFQSYLYTCMLFCPNMFALYKLFGYTMINLSCNTIVRHACWRANILQELAHKNSLHPKEKVRILFHRQFWDVDIFIDIYIYICRYTLQEVQLVPGIINFICAVNSQLQIAPVLLGGEVVSQFHLCKQLIFVKTQQLSSYSSTWWAYRSLFAKSFESYTTWHLKTHMTKEKSATSTYVDVMAWWCLKILNPKEFAQGTFPYFTWVLKFLRWHNEWMAPKQGCLIDPLLTISASTVSSTVTGTGKVGGSPTPSHWKHPDISFINSMLLRFSSLILV